MEIRANWILAEAISSSDPPSKTHASLASKLCCKPAALGLQSMYSVVERAQSGLHLLKMFIIVIMMLVWERMS